MATGIEKMGLRDGNAAIFFPYVQVSSPVKGMGDLWIPPGGAIAGIIARIDESRGVWKAPAGVNADLINNPKLRLSINDQENELLSQKGINALRHFPNIGSVIWGARTLIGDDKHNSEWKYIPVRRTALFIEASLQRGLRWVVFEPNAEPLWAQIRTNVSNFMNGLFRKGAFAGTTPDEAFFVKCDDETITAIDITQGNINLLVGFAPLKPAEFIILKFHFKVVQET
jgi:phage tail sheath protein FI